MDLVETVCVLVVFPGDDEIASGIAGHHGPRLLTARYAVQGEVLGSLAIYWFFERIGAFIPGV